MFVSSIVSLRSQHLFGLKTTDYNKVKDIQQIYELLANIFQGKPQKKVDETFAVISQNVDNGHSSTFKSPHSNRLEDVNVDEGGPERRFGYLDLDDDTQDDDEPNLVIDFNVRSVEVNDGQPDDCSDRNDIASTSSAPVMVAPSSCVEKEIDKYINTFK